MILFTVDAAGSFGDAQLAQFQKFAPYIVEAELGRTAVTDASFDTLKQFTHLRALHLEETHITGDGLAKLTSLSQLTYLNLSGTQVTEESVRPLSSMKNLRHIYLYNTPAQPAANPQPTQPIARSTAMNQTHLQPATDGAIDRRRFCAVTGVAALGDADRSTAAEAAIAEHGENATGTTDSRRATANGLMK